MIDHFKVVVDFSASWCGPCKMIGPIYDQLSAEKSNKNVKFIKVDIDENQELAMRYQVKSMPTFVFIKNTKEISRFCGADIVKLKDYIRRLS
jgi:thioredoxin 1